MSTPEVFPLTVSGSGNATNSTIRILSFNQLLPTWADEIRARARKRATPWCPAEDLEQAGLIALWKATRSFRSERGSFEHYVRRAIRNAMESARRRTTPLADLRPEFVPMDDTTLWDATYKFEPLDASYLVSEWVRGLPQPLAAVFDLLYRQGFTQTEAGAIMGISQGRISQLHSQLLARGRAELADLKS